MNWAFSVGHYYPKAWYSAVPLDTRMRKKKKTAPARYNNVMVFGSFWRCVRLPSDRGCRKRFSVSGWSLRNMRACRRTKSRWPRGRKTRRWRTGQKRRRFFGGRRSTSSRCQWYKPFFFLRHWQKGQIS